MQRIADTGRLVIAALTQPSPRQLMAFTNVQLLKRGGETVYFGPVGTNAELLRVSTWPFLFLYLCLFASIGVGPFLRPFSAA